MHGGMKNMHGFKDEVLASLEAIHETTEYG